MIVSIACMYICVTKWVQDQTKNQQQTYWPFYQMQKRKFALVVIVIHLVLFLFWVSRENFLGKQKDCHLAVINKLSIACIRLQVNQKIHQMAD